MKILYGKIGRSFNLNRVNMSTLGGDVDVLNLLERLAHQRPEDEIVIVSRNTGENPQEMGLPANVRNVWHGSDAMNCRDEMLKRREVLAKMWLSWEFTAREFLTADHIVMWVGQHGTSNIPIPNVGTDWNDNVLTNPQDSFLNYVGFITWGINQWRDQYDGEVEESWLLPDVRNYFKGRDVKWPLRMPMLAQYDKEHQAKFERWQDPRDPSDLGFDYAKWEHSAWVTEVKQRYAGVELAAITDPSLQPLPSLEGRLPFGMLVNENAKDRKPNRLDVLCEWVMPQWPTAEIFGTWSDESQRILGRGISALPHHEAMEAMSRWRTTFTTPASGSGWATAKPWEAFLMGTVCFFHPKYDEQDHILRDADPTLRTWLRCDSPEQLRKRIDAVMRDDATYEWLVNAQRAHLTTRFTADQLGDTLDLRIGFSRDTITGQTREHLPPPAGSPV